MRIKSKNENFNYIYSNEQRILDERAKYRVYCKCGHSLIIYPMERKTKKVCSHCGNYVYINERAKFKELLDFKLREVNS